MAFINKEVFKESLQEKLEEPTLWKDTAEVTFTSDKTVHFPYRDLPTASSYTRGAQYSPTEPVSTDDTMVIDDTEIVSEFMDYADLAQNGYIDEVEMGQAQAIVVNEIMESTMTGLHTQAGLSLDDGDFGGTATNPLAVTGGASGNIGTVFQKARTLIASQRGGLQYMNRFGMTAILDPQNYEYAVSYAQKNGFMFSDKALESGEIPVINGFKVRESNLLDNTTDSGTVHCLFGVDNMMHLGVLNTTFGSAKIVENPDRRDGVDAITRVDRKGKIWNNHQNFVIDTELVG